MDVIWTSEIEKIFQIHHDLTTEEVIRILINNGITDAAVMNRKMNGYATIARLVKQGQLEKTARGTYRKKQQEV